MILAKSMSCAPQFCPLCRASLLFNISSDVAESDQEQLRSQLFSECLQISHLLWLHSFLALWLYFLFNNWEIFGFTHQKYKIFRRRKDTLSTDHVAQKLKFYRGCRAWHYVVSVSLCETISRPLIGEKLSRINVLRHLI